VPLLAAPPIPISRILARGRPAADPECAGCAQLGLFRALRRAGLGVQGGPGCDPAAARAFETQPGRWAAVAGAAHALSDPAGMLSGAAAAGARVLVVADRELDAAPGVEAALARAGARVVRLEPGDLGAAEAAARHAAEAGGTAIVALSSCPRGAPTAAPFAIAASRCNRCGACLALGCPAISDAGGEVLEIDATTCTGCGLCAPLCRARALVTTVRDS